MTRPEEGFSLRRLAREVVEDRPGATVDGVIDEIMLRIIDTDDLREALRQAITPLVLQAFEERDALDPSTISITGPIPSGQHRPAALVSASQAVPVIRHPAATTDRGDSDQTVPALHKALVAVTPSKPGGGDHVTPDPHKADVTPARSRRTKASLVRSAAKSWLENQQLQTSYGQLPLGSCSFEDLMDGVRLRRTQAYASMAQADTIERLANLVKSRNAATVADLPQETIALFMDNNPQVC